MLGNTANPLQQEQSSSVNSKKGKITFLRLGPFLIQRASIRQIVV